MKAPGVGAPAPALQRTMVKAATIYYLHSQLETLSTTKGLCAVVLLSTYNWKMAFWFAPAVTQITSEPKFNVYARIEKIWTDSHNDYKCLE